MATEPPAQLIVDGPPRFATELCDAAAGIAKSKTFRLDTEQPELMSA